MFVLSVLNRLGSVLARPFATDFSATPGEWTRSFRQEPGHPATLSRQILQLAWPTLVENFLQTMLGVVDLIFVGQLGANAIAGVGLGNQLMGTLVVAFYGLSVGNQALVARSIGSGNKPDAQRVAKQSLILVALLSIVVGVLGYPIGELVIGFMGATPVVTQLGSAFMGITSVFALFLAVMVIGGGTLRGAGDTRTPMMITGVVNVINIVLDYGLIFGNLGLPRVGALGSAYATSAARGVGAILILYALFRRGSVVRIDWRHGWRISKRTIGRILDIGWPSAMEQIIFQLGFLVFSAIVVGLGTDDLAAMQIAFNIANFSSLPAFAFGVAALTLVGQNLGANNVSRAQAVVKEALKNSTIWMSLMGLGFIIFRRQLFGMYTNDPQVLDLGTLIMAFIAAMQPLQSVAFVLAAALRGAGDTRAPMVITGVAVWVVRVGIGYVLGILLGMGLFGVWLGWCADFCMRAVVLTLRYRSGHWKTIRL